MKTACIPLPAMVILRLPRSVTNANWLSPGRFCKPTTDIVHSSEAWGSLASVT